MSKRERITEFRRPYFEGDGLLPDRSGHEALADVLQTLSSEHLKDVLTEFFPWDGSYVRIKLLNALQRKAIKNETGWQPQDVSQKEFQQGMRLGMTMASGNCAEPMEIDDALWFASGALLRKNYQLARHILSNILPGLANGDLYCGFDEFASEVLDYDLQQATNEYALATYFCLPVEQRPKAISEVLGFGDGFLFSNRRPITSMTDISVEPLCQYDEFLVLWCEHMERRKVAKGVHRCHDENDWLSEARELAGKA